MAGPYPLATLGPTITAAGITIPSYADIYASLQASFQQIYGTDAYIAPDSQDGQWIAIQAQAYSDINDAAVTLYNAFSPSFAQGAQLSSEVRINGLTRLVASNSTADVNVVGTAFTTINNGVAKDANGNLWNLPAVVTIPIGGTLATIVTAQQVGNIPALSGTINTIFTPQLGWTSIVSTADATTGAPVETDSALRVRQAISVAIPALTPLQSIAGAIAAVPGVIRSAIYQNDTSDTDINGVPDHTISVIAQGGDPAAIALTIERTKNPGTGTYGNTTEVVTDPTGLPVTIYFNELVSVPIYVALTIKALPNYASSTTAIIKQAMIDFINALQIGEELRYTWMNAPASLNAVGLGQTFYIVSLYIAITSSPSATVDIPIAYNAAATAIAANVSVTVT